MDNGSNSSLIRGAILAMDVDNDTKTKLFNYLDELENRDLFLTALENSGVDNWEWYGEAQDLYEKYQNGEE